MIEQIRHLQSRAPFETFALELANGRVIQIHERHLVATTSGTHHGEGVIGVLYENGSVELINADQILSVSVGGSSEGQRRVCTTNGVGQKRIRGVGDPSGRPCPGRAKLKTETLNVIEPSTGRVLGTIEPDIIRLDKLLYIGGFHGWRAWECLSERERAEFGLEQEDAVRFERAVM